MRGALALIAVMASAAATAAAPPLPDAPTMQVVCVGQIEAGRGEAMTVFIHVDPDGTRPASYASWLPPQIAVTGPGGLDQPDVSLLIGYNAVSAGGIGKPAGGSVLALVFAPLRERIAPPKLQARLALLTGEARFDQAAPVPFGLSQPGPAHGDLPGTAMRRADLALPDPLPREVELKLIGKGGKPGVTVRFATGSTESRDALFARAWILADNTAKDPASCEPTVGADARYAGTDGPN